MQSIKLCSGNSVISEGELVLELEAKEFVKNWRFKIPIFFIKIALEEPTLYSNQIIRRFWLMI